jgi:GT2 family glycosyltransferase
MSRSPLDGRRPGRLANLPRRVYLTYRYHGASGLVRHALLFPLRLVGLDRALGLGTGARGAGAAARRWYRDHGRPVTIVIPSYRDAPLVAKAVAAIRRTTPAERVRIIVADDASGPEHVAALGRIEGITQVIVGEANAGFSANANRGLRAADPAHDVVLLNSDVTPLRDWLACLQHAVTGAGSPGIAGAKLLYPDNRIQYGGTVRNAAAPEWFDHRYRGKPADWGPADVPGPTLAATGACMYIRRDALDAIGLFDEAYAMAYEDVDYCLRAWQSGYQVAYVPSARLYHHESATRGTAQGERELASQRVFWERWASLFGPRPVRTDDGRLRVIYVTEGTIVAGGHRVVFEHLNGLAARGHDVQLWTLQAAPSWFALHCPVRTFAGYDELAAALAPLDAIKVATWWSTAATVWRASVLHGIPAYLVQDIETSYYPDSPDRRYEVLNSYRPEFRYLAGSGWIQSELRELGLQAQLLPPALDGAVFRPREDTARRDDMVLALGRSDPLKNLPLTLKAWGRLPAPRPELCLFGNQPELATEPGVRYVRAPPDEEVNELLNQATVFLQTSTHEGFCLPALEAMATGGAVVCTDAHGNRDYCVDGVNCLMPEATPAAVAAALQRVLGDPGLRRRLGDAGRATAAGYDWTARIDTLERFLHEIAGDDAARDLRPRAARSD